MDSPQSVISPFKNLSVASEPEKNKPDVDTQDTGCLGNATDLHKKGANNMSDVQEQMKESIGVLDVYIHQARDIHNICIYHKQDVYAKVCMTSDPENTVSTQIINGGGRNPVFSENLRLKIRTVESSLKCEIWMLSRVRNYLEDQLLGFALVPMSEVLLKNGNLEKEFSLSSTDLFHSPAGFVQLSLSYSGSSPEVMMIPKLPVQDGAELTETETSEYDKIEFPDPNIVNENQIMVSEYFEINCNSLDTHSTESLVSSGTVDQLSSENGVHDGESFSANTDGSTPLSKINSPATSVSNNGSPVSVPTSSQSSETPVVAPKSPNSEQVSSHKEGKNDGFTGEHIPSKEEKGQNDPVGENESESSNGPPNEASPKPIVGVINVELPEEKVIQQDFVDMYMKSMQQFTESLAKMKLPMDLGTEPSKSDNSSSSSDQKLQGPKTPGSRVFYGSRAFF